MSLRDALAGAGARLGEVDGAEVPLGFGDLDREVRAIRASCAISVQPHASCLRFSGEGAYDAIDPLVTSDLSVRNGRMRQTLMLREDGRPLADAYLCNDDDTFLLIAEGVPRADLLAHVDRHRGAARDVAVEDLGAGSALISLDGPFAWEIMTELEGPGVLGCPYLSFFRPRPGSGATFAFRAGKTGEYGFHLLVPRDEAGTVFERLLAIGRAVDAAPAGLEAIQHAMLEAWFFDIHRHGAGDVTPIELQLQWRLSCSKPFVGAAAVRARSAARRVTALQSGGPMAPGDEIALEGRPIGVIVDAVRSVTLGDHIAMALLDQPFAHSRIEGLCVHRGDGESPARTVSPPFVEARSLFVNPTEHTYATRDEIAFPSPMRNPPRAS